jgi:prepilin peptidase CpaA
MLSSLFATNRAYLAAGIFFTGLCITAGVADVRSRRIPNSLVACLACTGLLFSLATARTVGAGAYQGFVGLGAGLCIWLPFYAVGWLGAGDVKLFAAAGAWLGPWRTVEAATTAALGGGILALFWMFHAYGFKGAAARGVVGVLAPRTLFSSGVHTQSSRAIPYGVALATGALMAAWFGFSSQ